MDLELQATHQRLEMRLQTPPKKVELTDRFETPRKKLADMRIDESPLAQRFETPKKTGENPESKNIKQLYGTNKKNSGSNHKIIAEFNLSRLEQDYHFLQHLGQGNFSSVSLYKSVMTGELFAIKITKLSSMSVNEAQALGTLSIFSQRSKNIVRYFYSWVEYSQIYIVMEFCSHNLTSMINEHRVSSTRVGEGEIKSILRQALQGLKCMHEHKMVHLDIKADNLLFKDSILKISDLGLTRISRLKRQSDLDEGDSRYLAKELLNYHPSIDLTKSDIFSLGMTVYEAISLESLPNNGPSWQSIRINGLLLTSRMDLQEYSAELLEIVEQMTKPDWRHRPSATEILRHPYFNDSLCRKSRIFADRLKAKPTDRQHQRKKESSV